MDHDNNNTTIQYQQLPQPIIIIISTRSKFKGVKIEKTNTTFLHGLATCLCYASKQTKHEDFINQALQPNQEVYNWLLMC